MTLNKKRNNYHFFIRVTSSQRKILGYFFIYKMFSNRSFQIQVTWNYLKKRQKVDLYQSKIMMHKLCDCLKKLLVKKYLFFVLSNNMLVRFFIHTWIIQLCIKNRRNIYKINVAYNSLLLFFSLCFITFLVP